VLGQILVLAALVSKVMNGATTTTTAPPRPECGFGKVAIYKADKNEWICVVKGFG